MSTMTTPEEVSLLAALGRLCRNLREKRGYTPNYVCQRIARLRQKCQSLSGYDLKRFEEGEKGINLETFVALLEVLHVSIALLDREEIIAGGILTFPSFQPALPEPEPPVADDYEVIEVELDRPQYDLADRDPLFDDSARLIVAQQQASTSLIQRKFTIGYNRAGRIMEQLALAGIVGPFEGSKPRQLLIQDVDALETLLASLPK